MVARLAVAICQQMKKLSPVHEPYLHSDVDGAFRVMQEVDSPYPAHSADVHACVDTIFISLLHSIVTMQGLQGWPAVPDSCDW